MLILNETIVTLKKSEYIDQNEGNIKVVKRVKQWNLSDLKNAP